MDYSEVKWNLSTLLFLADCRHQTESMSKTGVLSSKRMDNPSTKLTKIVCSWTSVICHDTTIGNFSYSFSYSWSSEKKKVRLRVRPCCLLQSRLSKDERSYHPLAVSFPSSFYSESCTSLQIWMRWKCCSTTLARGHLKSRWPTSSGLSGGDGWRYRCRQVNFVLGFHAENRKEHLIFFFFLADWQKSMRAHNEKHGKKLAWPLRNTEKKNCSANVRVFPPRKRMSVLSVLHRSYDSDLWVCFSGDCFNILPAVVRCRSSE